MSETPSGSALIFKFADRCLHGTYGLGSIKQRPRSAHFLWNLQRRGPLGLRLGFPSMEGAPPSTPALWPCVLQRFVEHLQGHCLLQTPGGQVRLCMFPVAATVNHHKRGV